MPLPLKTTNLFYVYVYVLLSTQLDYKLYCGNNFTSFFPYLVNNCLFCTYYMPGAVLVTGKATQSRIDSVRGGQTLIK